MLNLERRASFYLGRAPGSWQASGARARRSGRQEARAQALCLCAGKPVAGAIVDVLHANTKGGYSFFDPSQSKYNLRRRIETEAEGRYRFRSILPSGYACPPNGVTQALLNQLGRHGNRPAHIHCFVSAPGYRKLWMLGRGGCSATRFAAPWV